MIRGVIAWTLAFAICLSVRNAIASDEGSRLLMPAFQNLVNSTDKARFEKSASLPSLLQLRRDLGTLEQHLNKLPVSVPEEYELSLKEYAALLGQSPLDASSIEVVASDVRLKNQFFGEPAGFWPVQKRLLIDVRVRTFRRGVPAPGYRVSFNPLSDARMVTPIFPVASDTNDASRLLPPGNYFMLLSGEGQTIGKIVPIGMKGSDLEPIDIDVSDVTDARTR